ncbi:MAG TPA: aspartate--tRNA ligase [Planctomycetota bacterium]|nr:aspartate--tRNA ligase [Planctomycetota bacterium]
MWTLRRTHNCGEVRSSHIGNTVRLNGWVDTVRDHGKVIFVDVRDREGRTQLVFKHDRNPELHQRANGLRPETVIAVEGVVRLRDAQARNSELATGDVEIEGGALEVLNPAKPAPFEISGELTGSIEIRLRYRYLDLRRPSMQHNIRTRSRVTHSIRRYFDSKGFIDIETPYMLKYTPGGARNFLIPCRLIPGQFYALAESPQILKQLFMIAGFDKYYQVARCFRDEDLRADRQPEFTQLDLEMSFVDRDDVMAMVEGSVEAAFREVAGVQLKTPFERISYDRAMLEYGVDKPDLRFELKIADVSEVFRGVEFGIAKQTFAAGGVFRGLAIPGGSDMSRKDIDELGAFVGQLGGKGVLTAKVEAGPKIAGTFAKFLDDARMRALCSTLKAREGDLLVLVGDKPDRAAELLGAARLRLGAQRKLIDSKCYRVCWVVDFPMFEVGPDGSVAARHHPFTSPKDEDVTRIEADPASVHAKAYDLVINGVEVGGGSIRIHRRDLQQRVFKAIGLSDDEAREKFGFFLEAFEYGAPPHGGIALGLDRLAMLILGLDSIRDVLPFPKTQKGQDLMMGSPSTVSDAQLKDLGIKVIPRPPST